MTAALVIIGLALAAALSWWLYGVTHPDPWPDAEAERQRAWNRMYAQARKQGMSEVRRGTDRDPGEWERL